MSAGIFVTCKRQPALEEGLFSFAACAKERDFALDEVWSGVCVRARVFAVCRHVSHTALRKELEFSS